nr:DUF2934 domain-containing protein [Methylorubrum sp. Q1]
MLCENSVRERAYYIWEGEGRVFGRAEAHWLQAESELRQAPVAALIEAEAPAKVAKPRTARAKPAVQAPAEALASVAKAAKSAAKAKTPAKALAKKAPATTSAKAAEKPAAKAVKAAPRAKPAASRAGAEALVLH